MKTTAKLLIIGLLMIFILSVVQAEARVRHYYKPYRGFSLNMGIGIGMHIPRLVVPNRAYRTYYPTNSYYNVRANDRSSDLYYRGYQDGYNDGYKYGKYIKNRLGPRTRGNYYGQNSRRYSSSYNQGYKRGWSQGYVDGLNLRRHLYRD